ncbi:amidohydrolase family protein [Microbulbifer sp. SSSA002]|uniref:amidohydrolase family protein n=1 Tax=Microbulbifer sp. SSSA002 TaxID=3243376 RepID=UPI00403A2ACD
MKATAIVSSLLLASSTSFALETKENDYDLRIDNVQILTSNAEGFSEKSRIYIQGDRIAKITPMTNTALSAETSHDAQGAYAIPGLIDLHVHLSASGSTYKNYQHLPLETNLNNHLYYGVTAVTDLLMSSEIMQSIRQLDDSAPLVFASGPAFTNPKGHGTQFGVKVHEIDSVEQISASWDAHLSYRPKLTKAIIETFDGTVVPLSDDVLEEIGKRSQSANLPFFVHVSTLEDGKRAIRAGATALAHGINFEPVDNEFIELMQQNKVTYIPTLSVYHNQGDEHEHQSISQLDLAPIHPKMQACLFNEVQAPTTIRELAWQKKSVAYNNVIKLAKAGIKIGAGSDSGNPYSPHGLGLISEILALRKAGLSNQQVLLSTTQVAAQTLNAGEDIGSISQGKRANFILLNENPIKNIQAITNPEKIYLAGAAIERKQLIERSHATPPIGSSCESSAEKQGHNI